MEQGWVKLHRQLADNQFLMNDDKCFNVFMKLLIHVNRKGEIAAGRRQLGTLFNINDRTLYDVLLRLENQQIINIKSNHKYSVIAICNWSKYQQTPTAQPTVTQPQTNRKPTTDQHSNKNKKENKKNSTNVLVDSENPRTVSTKDFFMMLVKELGFTDKVRPTDGRLRKLRVRLGTFKPADLIAAARVLAADGYMQGDNEQGKRYGTIDYLLRSDEIVDKYLTLHEPTVTAENVKETFDESRYL